MRKLLILAIFTLISASFTAAQCPLSAFQTLQPERKSEFWREKLRKAEKTEELDFQQARLLEEIADFAAPELYSYQLVSIKGSKEEKRAKKLEKEALRLFPRKQLRRIFGGATTESIATCNCSVGSYFNMSCDYTCAQLTCAGTADGCGFVGLYKCDGWCGTS